jgi:peptide/nickel transport system permease protein
MALSFLLGIFMGGLSGYYGGVADNIIQRVIEFLRSVPTIPLWMALSAALPPTWPPLRVYFGITIILSLISWTGLARVVRSKFLSLREEDFIMAAQLSGTSEMRIIFRHLLPSFLSHIIASLTLSIPGLILSETSLSFIGLGLRPPTISWGVLMKEAQNLVVVAKAPWLLAPGLFIVITVLSFNFMGDGLRDAADPYVR